MKWIVPVEIDRMLAKSGDSDPHTFSDDRSRVVYFLSEVADLQRTVRELPHKHDLRTEDGRVTARGGLLLHLWTVNALDVPAPARAYWTHLFESTKLVAAALWKPMDSDESKRFWKEATRRREAAIVVAALWKGVGPLGLTG